MVVASKTHHKRETVKMAPSKLKKTVLRKDFKHTNSFESVDFEEAC